MRIKTSVLTICITISACILLSIIGQLLPISVINKNVTKSKVSFSSKVSYSKDIANYISTQQDDFTDAILLTTAGYSGNESAVEKALANYRMVSGDPCESLKAYAPKSFDVPDSEMQKISYARYWIGSVFFIKLLLLFFDYSGIQMLNQILQLGLLTALIILMTKKNLTKYIFPLITSLLWLMPGTIYLSLQYSAMYYVLLILMMLIVITDKYTVQESFYLTLFTCAGVVTNWLDFLTYPLATLGLPLVLLMLISAKHGKEIRCLDVIKIAVCWAAGYFGMWILKWCLATLVLQRNVFAEALNQAKFRTSQSLNDIHFSRIDVIIKNLRVMYKRPYFFLLIAAFLYSLKNSLPIQEWQLRRILPFSFVAMMPIAWYLVLSNHSWIHYWFTYRILCISIFAFLCGVIQIRCCSEGGNR